MTSPTLDRRQGLVGNTPMKAPVDCATTGNITLSGEQVVDGVQTASSRVLVLAQTDPTQNGIYDSSSASWTRSKDADGNYDLTTGTIVLVLNGATLNNTFYQVATPKPITIGSSALTFQRTLTSSSTVLTFIAAGVGAFIRSMQSKERDRVHMRDYGAACDGVTNDSVALQSAHDAIVLAGGGTLDVSRAKLNSTFNWNANLVEIRGDGGVWDFSGLGAGLFAVQPIQTEPDVNARGRKNKAHPFSGVVVLGPVGAPTSYFINIADTVGNSIPGITLRNGGSAGFIVDITFGAGSFFTLIQHWTMSNDAAGRRSNRHFVNPTSTNSGERNIFDDVQFGLANTENFNQSNGNADTILTNCSFNGTNGPRFGTLSGGSLKIINPHCEWTGNSDVRIELIAGANPQLVIENPTLVPGAGQSTFGFLKIDPTITTTCAFIINPMVASSSPITVPWDDGGGRLIVTNDQRYASTGYTFLPSAGQNMLAYGDFESGSYTNEFVLATNGSHAPARVNGVAKTGSWSLGFQGIVGEQNTATVKLPCKPGQTLNYSFWYRADALTGTGSNFFANLSYLDAAGVVITTIPQIFITTTTTPVNVPTNNFVFVTPIASVNSAPPGTAFVRIQFLMQSTTSGTPLGYIDVVRMVVQ